MAGVAGRRGQVLLLIRQSLTPLADDQIAQAAQMNRVYVNTICRKLAEDKLIIRGRIGTGKIVNVAVDRAETGHLEQEREVQLKRSPCAWGRDDGWHSC